MAYKRKLFNRIEKIEITGKFTTIECGEFGPEIHIWYVTQKTNGKAKVLEDKKVLITEEELNRIPDYI